jgi:hypothetical protein
LKIRGEKRKMNKELNNNKIEIDEEKIRKIKSWLRARSSTIESEAHLKEILEERFLNADEIIDFLIREGIIEDLGNGRYDLIKLFRGISIYSKEEGDEDE